mmetsp:Transcript_15982/g.48005  ORF Transcript_15982/g.48005 Transcript_15982/m.48005 type:complete len:223 (+) Transcript_15982:447-1115(+)
MMVDGHAPVVLSLQIHAAREHQLAGPRHEHVTLVALAPPPLDGQRPSWEVYTAGAVPIEPALQYARHYQSACTSAAGEGGSRAPLPHLHPHVFPVHHLNKLCVCLSGKHGVGLELRSNRSQVQLVNLDGAVGAGIDNGVGVAHGHCRHRPGAAPHFQLRRHHRPVLGRLQSRGHLAGFKDGWPHVHTHQPIICQAWLDQTCEGVYPVGSTRPMTIPLRNEVR